MESIVDLPVKISRLYPYYLLQNIKNKMAASLIPQKGMVTQDFGSHIWCARTTACVYFAHFWTGDAQKHVFSDSKVCKSKIKSRYYSQKKILYLVDWHYNFFITVKKKNPR